MAIRSMTGFGRGKHEVGGWRIVAEARSLNHRGLDVRVNAPSGLAVVESALRKHVKQRCQRGRVECRVQAVRTGGPTVGDAAIEQA